MGKLHTYSGSGAKSKISAFTKNSILVDRRMVSHFSA
jgi:hypothetical protein